MPDKNIIVPECKHLAVFYLLIIISTLQYYYIEKKHVIDENKTMLSKTLLRISVSYFKNTFIFTKLNTFVN